LSEINKDDIFGGLEIYYID